MNANATGGSGSRPLVSEAAAIVRIFQDHMGFVPEGYGAENEAVASEEALTTVP